MIFRKYAGMALLCLVSCGFGLTAAQAQMPAPNLPQDEVLEQLESVIGWQRDILSLETLPKNSLQTLLKKNLKATAVKVLQNNFDFAKAQASISDPVHAALAPQDTPDQTRNQEIQKRAADVDATILRLQTEISATARQLARASRKARQPLQIRRAQLENELKLAQAQDEVLKNVVTMFSTTDTSDAADLNGKIDNLLQTLPELQDTAAKPPAPAADIKAATAATANAATAEPARQDGILSLVSDMLSLYRKKKEIGVLISETHTVQDNASSLIKSMRDTMQAITTHGNSVAQNIGSDTLDQQRKEIDQLIGQYKQISTAIIPLGQGNRLMDASIRNLEEWNTSLDRELKKILQSFSLRLIILFIAIMIPLILSEAVRRVTHRYISDARRQRQLRRARRIVFGIIILIIIILNLVTELGSLATYVGFVTAGLAVALQNIILSVVAHFFFFGRFGVRIGDRVTVDGVTGDVVHIGITRLYLMQVEGPDFDLQPSGKIVGFPNSILFQPNAFSKKIPGAHHVWQEMKFLLDSGTDHGLAMRKMNEAVNTVFSQYHDLMLNQQAALSQATHLNIALPAPKIFLNFTDGGLAIIVRYPIDSAHLIEASQRITQQIVDALEKEPSLHLVNGTPPKIKAVTLPVGAVA